MPGDPKATDCKSIGCCVCVFFFPDVDKEITVRRKTGAKMNEQSTSVSVGAIAMELPTSPDSLQRLLRCQKRERESAVAPTTLFEVDFYLPLTARFM